MYNQYKITINVERYVTDKDDSVISEENRNDSVTLEIRSTQLHREFGIGVSAEEQLINTLRGAGLEF